MSPLGSRRGPAQDPLDYHYRSPYADPALEPDAAHRQAMVLSEVAAEGPVGLFRVLRRGASGDADAASVPVSALLRASPGMTLLDSHDFLRRAHIPAATLTGELTPGQRVALVYVVDGSSVTPESG